MDQILIQSGDFQLSQIDFIIRLLVAIGIGAIIGLEREYTTLQHALPGFAGIRTIIFVVVLGFIGGLMYYLFSPWIFLVIFLGVVSLIAISYWASASRGDIGATTEFSALIAFFLGTLTFIGLLEISLVITVLVVVLLSAKLKLHALIGKITATEMYDFIRFVVITLLIFPFLPNETFGPYNVINPREIGWVVILTSGLGFVGYILMKLMGPNKGILLSGIVGGLVSSTAVTWVFAKKSKENEAISRSCATAIIAASSIMIVRVLVWVFIFNQSLFNELLIGVVLIFVVAIGTAIYFFYSQKNDPKIETDFSAGKPLDLKGALIFGVIFTVILLVVSYANENLGERGILLSSAIAGLSDIDAITISVSKLAGIKLDMNMATNAVLIGALSNTLVKMAIGVWVGSSSLKKYLLISYGCITLATIFALFLVNN